MKYGKWWRSNELERKDVQVRSDDLSAYQLSVSYDESEAGIFLIVKQMLLDLDSDLDRLIFIARFINNNEQDLIAEVCHLHKTNISRRVRNIRRKLMKYAEGYSFEFRPAYNRRKITEERVNCEPDVKQ